jgi:uncharacterized membrane protein
MQKLFQVWHKLSGVVEWLNIRRRARDTTTPSSAAQESGSASHEASLTDKNDAQLIQWQSKQALHR